MRTTLMFAATFVGVGVASAAAADRVPFAQRDQDFPPRVYTCRIDGTDVPLGGRACLATQAGRKPAECGFIQNVSTWKPSGGDCP